jgi:cytochrome c biogenesis protein CcmG/thiol:disulfide interchange protein DsbE
VTRRQVIGFVVVFALIAGGLLLRSRAGGEPEPRLDALRRAAALQPCPAGLGPELPDLTLPCLGGGAPVELRGKAPGRPMLVNVWASWCPPCVEEVPALIAFADKAAGRVGVVGVATEDAQDKALTFAAQFGMRYPSVVDDDGVVLRAFRPGPPVTLFLDASGRVAYKHSGKFRSTAEIEQLVREKLGVTL